MPNEVPTHSASSVRRAEVHPLVAYLLTARGSHGASRIFARKRSRPDTMLATVNQVMRATRLDVALLDLRSGAGRAEEYRSLRVGRIMRQLDCPDRRALRIVIGARVYKLARLAARTTQVFQRPRVHRTDAGGDRDRDAACPRPSERRRVVRLVLRKSLISTPGVSNAICARRWAKARVAIGCQLGANFRVLFLVACAKPLMRLRLPG
jgi:hypothetical protein